MGIDLNSTILSASAGLVATSGGTQLLKMATNGTLQRYNPGHPAFKASSSSSTVVSIGTVNNWNNIIFNVASPNVGGCYNGSNGRFTAPIAGIYLFTASLYWTVTTTGGYVHSLFNVNDSNVLRRPGGPPIRIHAHGQTGGYTSDSESFEMISLAAGDYVNFVNFNGGYDNTYYPHLSRFEGYLLS